jgi:hypothetical protein
MLILFMAGCTSSPRKEWAAGRATLTQAENALVVANQTGALPDSGFVATEQYVKAIRAGLDEADKELKASADQPTPRFRFYMNVVNSTLIPLSKPPTTRP